MTKTSTKTLYPDLVDANVTNSVDFTKKFTNYLNSIGSIDYSPQTTDNPAKTSTLVTNSLQPPLLINNKPTSPTLNSDGSYEVEARITFYSPDEPGSDYYSQQKIGANSNIYGPLQAGRSVAVYKNDIPYGSNIAIPGLGDTFRAEDTGGAVRTRQASRNTGGQPVIDVFVNSYSEQLRLARSFPPVVKVRVSPPTSVTPPPTNTYVSQAPITTNTRVSVRELTVAGGKRELNGDLTPQLSTSVDYWTNKKSANPITSISNFFTTLDKNTLQNYDNDFIFYWYKKFSSNIDIIKEQTDKQEYSFLDDPSDSIGTLVNTRVKFDDSVSPIFDITCSFGAPNTVPVSLSNKLSEVSKSVNEELSLKTSSLMKSSLINLQRVADTYNIAIDSTQPHGLNLVTDLNYYLTFYNSSPDLLDNVALTFQRTFEYVCYFSNINDKTGYNPRDYTSCNIQQIYNSQYSANIENTLQDFDISHKQIKQSRSTRTIAKVIGNTIETTQQKQLTTAQINDKFKYKTRTYKLTKPVSLTQSAQAKLNAAYSNLRIPNVNLANLNNQIDKYGLDNLELSRKITDANPLAKSVSSINNIVKIPELNMPNVLPSVDPGSFGEVFSYIVDKQYKNTLDLNDPRSFLAAIERTKTAICNFKLPIVGPVDFKSLFDGEIEFDPDVLEAKLRGLLPKFPKEDDFVKMFKDLVPDFNNIWKDFYAKFFECNNNKDYS